MTESALARIQHSYIQIAPRGDELTRHFYERLFRARPETRGLFQADMTRQRQHLATAMALIVRNLRILDTLELPLAQLGAAHTRAGVRPEHYPPVCEAMLHALAHVAGAEWSPQLSRDWRALMDRICRHMLAGAAQADACPNRFTAPGTPSWPAH